MYQSVPTLVQQKILTPEETSSQQETVRVHKNQFKWRLQHLDSGDNRTSDNLLSTKVELRPESKIGVPTESRTDDWKNFGRLLKKTGVHSSGLGMD